MTKTIFISIALLVVCWGIPNPNNVTNFLRGQVLCSAINFSQKSNIFLFQGLANHIDGFVEEEVEVRHIPHLSDGDLRSLGSVTIGSCQRICSTATAWVGKRHPLLLLNWLNRLSKWWEDEPSGHLLALLLHPCHLEWR